jgi:hypothetical protein
MCWLEHVFLHLSCWQASASLAGQAPSASPADPRADEQHAGGRFMPVPLAELRDGSHAFRSPWLRLLEILVPVGVIATFLVNVRSDAS